MEHHVHCRQVEECKWKRRHKSLVQSDICSFSVFGAFTMDVVAGTAAFGLETQLPDTTGRALPMFPFLTPLIRLLGKGISTGKESDFLVHSVYRMVDERRQVIGDEKRTDFLQLLVNAEDTGLDVGQKRMTREEVAAQGVIILIAGYETTATTLQYLTYNLAMNQDVQQRVYEEMRDELGDEDPTYDNVGRLKYLDNVIHETLRLFPPVSLIHRRVLHSRTIKGLTIPAGVGVYIPIYSIMHDPDYFDDPEKFWPERFSEAESSKLPSILSELAFGYGPRQCIGMRLALLEIKFAAVRILRHFRFLPCEDTPRAAAFASRIPKVTLEYALGALWGNVIARPTLYPANLSVAGAKGDTWRRLRHTMTPTFSTGKLKLMNPSVNRCCDSLSQALQRHTEKRQLVDVKRSLKKITKGSSIYSEHVDLLQLLLDSEASEADIAAKPQDRQMTKDEIIGQCITIFLAGYETTAATLQYMIYLLAVNPDKQEKLYDEIITTIGDDTATYENVMSLKYLDNTLKETLRCFPPAPLVTRIAAETTTIKDVTIQAGTSVGVSICSIMQDDQIFPEPSKFLPERFDNEDMPTLIRELAFGMGPRQCIGMRLALYEAKMAAVTIVRRFKFIKVPETPEMITFSTSARFSSPDKLIFVGTELRNSQYATWNHGLFTSLGIPGPKPLPFLGNARDINKKILANILPAIVTKGLFFTGGSAWKRLRRLMTPTFTAGKLKNMSHFMDRCANILKDNLQDKTRRQEVIDIKDVFGAFTMDVVAGTAFGLETNSQTQPAEPFIQSCKIMFYKMSGSGNRWLTIAAMFPFLSPLIMAMGKGVLSGKESDFLVHAVYRMVDERRQAIDDEKRCDARREFKGMSREEVAGQGFIILIAGYETTATTLQYLTYNLAMNQDVQQRVYEEMRDELGDEDPTYDNVGRLKYLDTVIQETLRVFPPVPLITRKALESRTIKGVTIPAGMGVGIPIYSIMHDPDYFDDPEEFRPERFSELKSSKLPSILLELPFGYGPRQCIGMRLALLEIKLAAVRILRHFRFLPCEDTPDKIEFGTSGLTSPTKPIKLRTELRE
ncbi:hypothetical protein C0Q70_13346 [Pomacea canaliculata]|uniref:Cytochrome P450 n=1 Tax=Pomacea canaliculata TaxID=400727 RepID=A0A2T7NWZ8_POMCA|nr:hypothetical protein C0Q70_13346 [Pomacea canaliculata]